MVSNSALTQESRERLETVADTVFERKNIGFDVLGYREAMEVFGRERLNDYEEIILMNYTFFGPIGSFDSLFEKMDSNAEIDFWGVTNHGEVLPHPFIDAPRMPMHIQSHWIAVRKSLFSTKSFAAYWDNMPLIKSYSDSIVKHESQFTENFSKQGFKFDVAYPEENYPSPHPIFDNITVLLSDGCPIVKRRTFFHDPIYLDKNTIIGRDIENLISSSGYPLDLIYSNIGRTTPPRVLTTNANLLHILPEQDLEYDHSQPLKIAAIAHIYYEEMTDEILDRFQMLPDGFDLYVTTTDETKKQTIEEVLTRRKIVGEIRVVSNRGRETTAFFIGCRDIIESDEYDLIVKLHSKKSPQSGYGQGELFKRHLFENLLSSPGYTANILNLFQKSQALGMVFPPVPHMGFPTLGHAWFTNRALAEKEAQRLGINVPFDDSTPIAPYGSMWFARPKALRGIARAGYRYEDFPATAEWHDGMLTHVIERLHAYAVLNEGYYIRQVLNSNFAATYYSFLEYKLQLLSSYLPGWPIDQIAALDRVKLMINADPESYADHQSLLGILKRRFHLRGSRFAPVVAPVYRAGRRMYRFFRPSQAHKNGVK